MASARRTDLAEVTDMMDVLPAEQPKMVVTHGRGGTGKSTGVTLSAPTYHNAQSRAFSQHPGRLGQSPTNHRGSTVRTAARRRRDWPRGK
jgi:hypothetical protein